MAMRSGRLWDWHIVWPPGTDSVVSKGLSIQMMSLTKWQVRLVSNSFDPIRQVGLATMQPGVVMSRRWIVSDEPDTCHTYIMFQSKSRNFGFKKSDEVLLCSYRIDA